MPNDNYQASVDKLNTYYKLASENSGKPQQFYTHLYKYIQAIDGNALLQRAANEFWVLKYIEDNKANEKKLQEVLAPIAESNGQPFNRVQQFQFMWRLFGQISSEKIKETKVYYCWYALYFNFYAIHQGSIDPKVIAKLGNVEAREVAAYLKELFGKDMPELSDELLAILKPIDTKELADKFERITSSVIPHDSSVTTDEYETCLGVFHTEFMDWLQTYQQQGAEEVEYVGNATIYYENHMTYVSLPNEKEPRKLLEKDIKPNSGYDYFMNYMFTPKNEGVLIALADVRKLNMRCEEYSNIGEGLRYCGFNIELKRVFMPKRRDANGFIYRKVAPVTQQQLDAIILSLNRPKKQSAKIVKKS
ncbi:MAG TPA: hypothetical protein VFN56_01205 [Candidatus Saccharimonadales bacterium]|nr:hypothetical protein [Candidatus Saccharimonadales bacterium]